MWKGDSTDRQKKISFFFCAQVKGRGGWIAEKEGRKEGSGRWEKRMSFVMQNGAKGREGSEVLERGAVAARKTVSSVR